MCETLILIALHQNGFPGKVFGKDDRFIPQPVVLSHHDIVLYRCSFYGLNVRTVYKLLRHEIQGVLQPAFVVQQFRHSAVMQVDFQERIDFPERCNHFIFDHRGGKGIIVEAEMFVFLLDCLLCGPVIFQYPLDVVIEAFSRSGWDDLPIAAFKELYAKLFLHLFQVLAHSGLCHIEDFGCTGEVLHLIHNRKKFQLSYRHRYPPSTISYSNDKL